MIDNWLESLGILGWGKSRSQVILVALITGNPILIMGSHGTAKTYLVKKIAHWLGLKPGIYDASKSAFEDLIGFIKPSSLNEGRLDYVQTELSLWDKEFIFIDELSRATPQLANKWLEILRNRTLMGKDLPQVSYVWAASNPTSDNYAGTNFLDDALLDRFLFLIDVPEISTIEDERILDAIIESRFDWLDTPLLEQQKELRKDRDNGIKELVKSVRLNYSEIEDRERELWRTYLRNLYYSIITMDTKGKKISGRTLNSLHKSIIALRGLCSEKGPEECSDEVMGLVKFAFPLLRYHEGQFREFSLESSHSVAWETVFLSSTQGVFLREMYVHQTLNILETTKHILENQDRLDELVLNEYHIRLDKSLSDSDDTHAFARSLACLIYLVYERGIYDLHDENLFRNVQRLEVKYLDCPYSITLEIASHLDLMEKFLYPGSMMVPVVNAVYAARSGEMFKVRNSRHNYFQYIRQIRNNSDLYRKNCFEVEKLCNRYLAELRH